MHYFNALEEITFEMAARDESLRQGFLNQIEKPDYINSIQYVERNNRDKIDNWLDRALHEKKISKKYYNAYKKNYSIFIGDRSRGLTMVTFDKDRAVGIGDKQDVFVYDKIFRWREEIFPVVLEHEFTHARDLYDGFPFSEGKITSKTIKTFNTKIINYVAEIRAYTDQVKSLNKRLRKIKRTRVNSEILNKIYSFEFHRKLAKDFIKRYKEKLSKVNPKSPIEEKVIQEYLAYK